MRILMDVDGVVADLVGGICRELDGAVTEEDVTDNDFARCLTEAQAERAFSAMARPGFCAGLPWYPGGKAFVHGLRGFGQLVAVTKPFRRGPTWAHERAEWLGEIPMVSTGHKELVSGNVLIEDLPENLERWLAEHRTGRGVLIDRPWNRHLPVPERTRRVTGYAEALAAVWGLR